MEFVNELANVKSANIIPDFVSVDEASWFVNEAVDRDLKNFDKKIKLFETRYFQKNGHSVVYEGVDLAAIKNAIIDKLKKLWEKIKSAFEFVLNKIKDICSRIASKFGNKKAIEDRLKRAKDKSEKLGKIHKFPGLADALNPNGKLGKSLSAAVADFNYSLNILQSNKGLDDYIKRNESDGNGQRTIDNTLTDILVAEDAKKSTEMLVKDVVGDEMDVTVADCLRKFKEYCDIASDYKYNVKLAKGMYDKTKVDIAKMQKAVNASKALKGSYISKQLARIASGVSIAVNVATRSLAMQNREIAKIMSAASRVAVEKPEKKATGESASMRSDLDALFDL